MAASATVTQSIDGETLTLTDTSTGITVTSRELTIKDANDNILTVIEMGGSTTASYPIDHDVYLSFVLVLNGSIQVIKNYISIQFYKNAQAQLAAYNKYPNKQDGVYASSMTKARECILSATTALSIGDGIGAQLMLDAADFYINNPTY